jgi:hypothetical protein
MLPILEARAVAHGELATEWRLFQTLIEEHRDCGHQDLESHYDLAQQEGFSRRSRHDLIESGVGIRQCNPKGVDEVSFMLETRSQGLLQIFTDVG